MAQGDGEAAATDWRALADPLADDAIAAWREAPQSRRGALPGRPPDRLTGILEAARERGAEPRLVAFADHVAATARAAPLAEMELGRRMGIRHAPRTFLALLTTALVESFARAEGAKVLASTGRLERDAKRRVYETASMVRDCLLEDGLGASGRGTEAVLRVRLLHADVRAFLRSRGFDEDRYGAPINQEDLLHTLLLFDRVLVRGVKDLGGAVTDDEDESWQKLWRHVGALMGIDPALLPQGPPLAEAAYRRLREASVPDDDSRRLTDAVLLAFAKEPPFFLPLPVLRAMSRRLVGPTLAKELGLGAPTFTDGALTSATRAFERLSAALVVVPGVREAEVRLGHAFVEANRWRVLRRMKVADYAFKTA